MLLRVLGLASGVCLALGPASGVCLALGPEFPEVVHRVPALICLGGGGGHIPIRGAPYILVCVCVKDRHILNVFLLLSTVKWSKAW